GIAEMYRVLGMIFTRKQAWTTAQELFADSLKITEEVSCPLDTAETYRELGEMHRRKGDKKEALRTFQSALKRFRKLGAKRDAEDVERRITGLEA
ncbi:MAG: tetratricopeptide repeat protein, partial [Candidatus Latescibacteria bacterium]|nr:tetratricopeptide repeat protein [Candidatus Latescibacterota bacterium]